MGVVTELNRALEPLHPYYALAWDRGDTDIEIAVYNPETHDRSFEAQITPSFARSKLEGAARFSIDGDEASFEEFAHLLDQLDAGEVPAAPTLTCSLSDAVEFLVEAAKRGSIEVEIDGARWLVQR